MILIPINKTLFDLQKTDEEIFTIKRERGQLNDGESLRAERDTLTKAVATEEAELLSIEQTRKDAEDQLKQREAKIETQQKRLMTAKNAHEVDALQRDIEALQKSRGDLDESILIAMDKAEATQQNLSQLQQDLQAKSQETEAVEKKFNEDSSQLDDQLAAATEKRESEWNTLNEEEQERYEDAAKRHSGVAVAHSENGSCSACGTELTPFNIKSAKKEEWPSCESCGRLLFVE